MAQSGQEVHNTQTMEISVRSVFWSLLSRWRGILLCGILLAVLLGGYKGIRGAVGLLDRETNQKAEETYQTALSTYNADRKLLNNEIKDLENAIKKKTALAENSLLLAIDPFKACKEVLVYYINTGYSVNPATSVQNIDKTGSVVSSYNSRIRNINIDLFLNEGGEVMITGVNPVDGNNTRVINSSTDSSNGILTITILADTPERLSFLVEQAKKLIIDSQSEIEALVEAHDIYLVSEYHWEDSVETSLSELRESFYENISDLKKEIVDIKKERSSLTKPVNAAFSVSGILKSIIKYGLLGLAIGLILGIFGYGLYFFSGKAILSDADFKDRYDAGVIGILTIGGETKEKGRNGWINTKRGLVCEVSGEEAARLAAKRLDLYAGEREVLCISSGGAELTDRFCELLQEQTNCHLISGGSLFKEEAGLVALQRASVVVFVENPQQANHHLIEKEVSEIQHLGKEILGFVLCS